jgi:hypothetical protein
MSLTIQPQVGFLSMSLTIQPQVGFLSMSLSIQPQVGFLSMSLSIQPQVGFTNLIPIFEAPVIFFPMVDPETGTAQNGFYNYDLSLHKNPTIIQNMTKT